MVKGAGTTSTYAYDPYGVTTTGGTGAAGGQNPYRFAPGSIYDRTTDMLKYGQRWYQPVTGRFTQQDSITHLANPQQGNKYAFAGDDPINNTDITGQSIYGYIAGAITGVILGVAIVLAPTPVGILEVGLYVLVPVLISTDAAVITDYYTG